MVVKYFGKEFLRTKYSALDGKTTISWQEQSQEETPFTVKVTSEGMTFEGKLSGPIITERDLQDFAKMVSDCWQDHRKLAPKITTSLSGH